MAERNKAGRPAKEKPTKIRGTFLDVFKVVKENKKQQANKGSNYSLPIDDMDLPIRLKTVLKNNGIYTLKNLATYHAEELLQLKNFGIKSISLVEAVLNKYGLRMGDTKH